MTTLFTICALFGGTLLICQTLLTLVGLGGDHDFAGDTHGEISLADCDHSGETGSHTHASSTWFFGIVTFRTLVAALTFMGSLERAGLRGYRRAGVFALALALSVVSGRWIDAMMGRGVASFDQNAKVGWQSSYAAACSAKLAAYGVYCCY